MTVLEIDDILAGLKPPFHDFFWKDTVMDHDAIELMIAEWHDSDSGLDLHEYLGWTWEEYSHYVETRELPW